jgi:hypothetical protein
LVDLLDILIQYSPFCKGIIQSLKAQGMAMTNNENISMDRTIARPGSVGNQGFTLRVGMELVHDNALYKRILVSAAF